MGAEFDPSQMLRALEANQTFEREELVAFWGVYVAELDDSELNTTQNMLHNNASWNHSMQETIVAEKMRRNPPNQVYFNFRK